MWFQNIYQLSTTSCDYAGESSSVINWYISLGGHFVPQIKIGCWFSSERNPFFVSANEQHDSTPLITHFMTAFILVGRPLLMKLDWSRKSVWLTEAMFWGSKFRTSHFYFSWERIYIHHFYQHPKMGESIQSGATQLVKSSGSFDRNIPRDTNVGQYGLFTFVVIGREMWVLEPKRQTTLSVVLLQLPWNSVRCNQAVKA